MKRDFDQRYHLAFYLHPPPFPLVLPLPSNLFEGLISKTGALTITSRLDRLRHL